LKKTKERGVLVC